jgi:hypothetical protein
VEGQNMGVIIIIIIILVIIIKIVMEIIIISPFVVMDRRLLINVFSLDTALMTWL